MIVKPIKLVASYLNKPDPFLAGCEQTFEDVSGEGSDIMRDFVVESENFLVEERSVGILYEGTVT